jgi:hypothetical protein
VNARAAFRRRQVAGASPTSFLKAEDHAVRHSYHHLARIRAALASSAA